ncbi:hypothetical protein [Myxococcus landrumensis]|uniref:Uncharacterized protein n=1 Tax=Myxococcus landrumensis TaxID=2813577 RepID=A0ABX7NB90_9BACT|nr:hypothetical protein [Myxococcus landrumus]QSQ15756.1 hypothetical protein JY572_06755 [Myxococcus landrumus]
MTTFTELRSYRPTPFVPRNYCDLSMHEHLGPADLVTLCAAVAWMRELNRQDLEGWYRSLTLALFRRFGLMALPQRKVIEEQSASVALLKSLGVVDAPGWFDALGRAWHMRSLLLALPNFASGVLEGHPFQLSVVNRGVSEELRPLAGEVADALHDHAWAARDVTRKLDRSIVALWGCPLDTLDHRVSVAELVAEGLKLQTFED